MISVDPLLNRKYSEQYHCVHFVIEAAQYLFGLDYSQSFIGFTSSLHDSLKASRQTAHPDRRLASPRDGCIVLMKNAKGSSHVGLFYCNRVLHLTELGVHFLPLISIGCQFKRIRFYDPITSIPEPTRRQ